MTDNQVRSDDRSFVFHSWSAQAKINPTPITRAEGCFIWDDADTKYFDIGSQLVNVNLGHQHPAVVKAIQEQAAIITTVNPAFANDKRGELARMVVERAGGKAKQVFFTNGGNEAVENAIRMARLHTGRSKVLASYRSYHGGSGNGIALTGEARRWGQGVSATDIMHFHGPNAYRSVFGSATEAEETENVLRVLEATIVCEGAASIAAIIQEPVVGSAAIAPPPPGYLSGLRALCDKYGIVLIADEVMVGFGRTGAWFAHQLYDMNPDLTTFAKGVNGGYVPLGGVIISEEIYQTFAERPYPGGLTYSGHPLACAAGVATLRAYEDEKIFENVQSNARDVLEPGLKAIAEKHKCVGNVRGVGHFWALELVKDQATREPLLPYGVGANEVTTALMGRMKAGGVWPMVAANRIHIAPPLIATAEQLREVLAVIDAALDEVDASL
ncbi:aminotransferase class III-fold pyridoxal phosphate-dependent enzyme [Micrococcales bacterium 31B]|nr:aminotransferase class III-fold pyridoxal phosphate-dependent enzyme [Micrococcales bacterium 31B]